MAYDKENPEQNWVCDYLAHLKDDFGLRDWKLVIMAESPDDDALACITPIYGQKFARLCLSDGFWERDDAGKRQTLLHELTHCHFSQSQHWCEMQIKSRAYAAFVLMHETGVDGLAEAIADRFPLPPKVSSKAKSRKKS